MFLIRFSILKLKLEAVGCSEIRFSCQPKAWLVCLYRTLKADISNYITMVCIILKMIEAVVCLYWVYIVHSHAVCQDCSQLETVERVGYRRKSNDTGSGFECDTGYSGIVKEDCFLEFDGGACILAEYAESTNGGFCSLWRPEKKKTSCMNLVPLQLLAGWWFQTCFTFHFIYGIILPID